LLEHMKYVSFKNAAVQKGAKKQIHIGSRVASVNRYCCESKIPGRHSETHHHQRVSRNRLNSVCGLISGMS
jgi:hypothetical protein